MTVKRTISNEEREECHGSFSIVILKKDKPKRKFRLMNTY